MPRLPAQRERNNTYGRFFNGVKRMSSVDITNNIPLFRDALDEAKARALEIIGGKAGRYVKALVPVDTGTLRNSITHTVCTRSGAERLMVF